jgi:hypothetical protein
MPTSLCYYSIVLHASRRNNKYQLIVFGLIRLGLEPRSTALEASMLAITPPMLLTNVVYSLLIEKRNTIEIIKHVLLCFEITGRSKNGIFHE